MGGRALRAPLTLPAHAQDSRFTNNFLLQNHTNIFVPAPDHFVTVSPKLSAHHSPGSTSSSRRSCQTCRDKLSERKRYLSKSREAIFEKVTNSQLKKSLSKSRERLCDMRLTLSKSREYLNDSKMAVSRSQEKFYSFKSLSKSQAMIIL